MKLYVLDTDHVTLYQRSHPLVVERIDAAVGHDFAVTLVTLEVAPPVDGATFEVEGAEHPLPGPGQDAALPREAPQREAGNEVEAEEIAALPAPDHRIARPQQIRLDAVA